jgi:hypothetical protein
MECNIDRFEKAARCVAGNPSRGRALTLNAINARYGDTGMEDQRSTVKTVETARQGVTGHNVRFVLLMSCTLAILAMGVVFFFVRS